jgi:hypothetical protein
MALVHFWRGADGSWIRLAIVSADIDRHPVQLAAVPDSHGNTAHPATEMPGILIRPRTMAEVDFNPLLTLITIAETPEFGFTPYTCLLKPEGWHITAIPYMEHLRRSVLPDWYVSAPAEAQQ